MRFRSRMLVGLLISAGAMALVCFWAIRSLNAGIKVAGQHKSAQHAVGTIVSVTALPRNEQKGDQAQRMRICFTIDSFTGLSREDQTEYEPAERSRQAREGPRCYDSHGELTGTNLKPGDHVEVHFLLENEGKMDSFGLFTHGHDL